MVDLAGDLAGGSGGGGAVSWWRPDQPPVAPANPLNDEMQGSGVAATWLDWDQGNVAAWSMDLDRHQLQCVTSTAAGERVAGLYKAAPGGGEYAVYCKTSLVSDVLPTDNTWFGAGLLIAGDIAGSPATAPFRTIGPTMDPGGNSNLYGGVWSWGNYTTLSAFVERIGPFIYSRARLNGAVLAADLSPDGQIWFNAANVNLGFTPSYIGLHATNYGNTAGRTLTARFSFFRVFEGAGTSGFDATEIGRYVTA